MPTDPRAPSLFVALRPSPEDAAILAESAELPPEALHVTLAFLGRVDRLPPDAWDCARRALVRVASRCAPVSARLGPLAAFPGPALRAVHAPLFGLDLVALREGVVAALRDEDLHADATHPFRAHLTLGQRAHLTDWHFPEPRLVDLRFDALWLCQGPDRFPIVLVEGLPPDEDSP